MTRILAIDASTEAFSVALYNQGETTEKYELAPRQHANLILPQVEAILAEADLKPAQLDAIGCNIGPGAFTGIRIGVSVAQGLAFGLNRPIIALSTLSNLAYVGARKEAAPSLWLTAIDARMNEVYFGAYRKDGEIFVCHTEESVIAPDKIQWQDLLNGIDGKSLGLIGSGWQAYENSLFVDAKLTESVWLKDCFPRAGCGLSEAVRKYELGEVFEAHELQPMYLRNNVAEKKKS